MTKDKPNSVCGFEVERNDAPTQESLYELSCHYDSMLWIVTSIWVGAIGGLLVYCQEKCPISLALLGLASTVAAMAFASSFRDARRRVQRSMKPGLPELHRSSGFAWQWPWFLLMYMALVAEWTWLLIKRHREFMYWWVALAALAAIAIAKYWWEGVDRERSNETAPLDS